MAGPLQSEGDANTTFENIELVPSQRRICSTATRRRRHCAVVAQKNNERLIKNVLCLERLQQLPNPFIQRRNHCRIHSARWIGDVCDSVGVNLGGLTIRIVWGVVRHKKEERLRRVSIDEGYALSCKRVC